MVVIYRMTDRIPVKVGELTFWLAPLSSEHKGRLLALKQTVSGESTENGMRAAALTLKLSVKGVDGVKNADGSDYTCEFDPDGCLTEDCVSELMQLDNMDKLTRLAATWATSDIKSAEQMRAEYEARVKKLHEEKKLTDEQYALTLQVYPLDGVQVDFSAIKSVKKKESVPSLVH